VQCRAQVMPEGLHDHPGLDKVSMKRKEREGNVGWKEGCLSTRAGS